MVGKDKSEFFKANLWVIKKTCCVFSQVSFFSLPSLFLFLFFHYCIQNCFVCHPSESTVFEDAGIEPRTVASHGLSDALTTQLDLIHSHLPI